MHFPHHPITASGICPVPLDLTEHPDFHIRYRYTAAIAKNQKVRIVPINLFTDDTSGNSSKKWNKFDSCSLVPAALSLEGKNKRENFHLICVHNRLTALEMLPSIVQDLKQLEEGIATSQSMVLVFAPLHLISADNPRHAEIFCIKARASMYPCRKCFFEEKKANEATVCSDHEAPRRDLNDIVNVRDGVDLPAE